MLTGFDGRHQSVHFNSAEGPAVDGFVNDHGREYSADTGFGWLRDKTDSTRLRKQRPGTVADGFVFTRSQDTWTHDLSDGRYCVTLWHRRFRHDQPGQYVSVEGSKLAKDIATSAGSFREFATKVQVQMDN